MPWNEDRFGAAFKLQVCMEGTCVVLCVRVCGRKQGLGWLGICLSLLPYLRVMCLAPVVCIKINGQLP